MKAKDALAFVPMNYTLLDTGDDVIRARSANYLYTCHRFSDYLAITVKHTAYDNTLYPIAQAEANFYDVPDDAEIDIKGLSLLVLRLEAACFEIIKQKEGVIK